MKTLAQLIEAQKCRKGKAAGTTKKGAYWLACNEIRIRSFGGDGIGQNAADMDYNLTLRHFRDGSTMAVIHYHSWHQNIGSVHKYTPVPELAQCSTVEQIIVVLKGTRADNGWDMENVYSDHKVGELTAALTALGMPEMEPAPDDEDPETAA